MKNIMIIGAAIGDVLVYPASPEVFASGSHPAREILLSTGGDGLNEATVLAGLGKDPYLCTLLGRDQMGELVKAHCQTRGIRQDFLRNEGDIPTGLNVVLFSTGRRDFVPGQYFCLSLAWKPGTGRDFRPGKKAGDYSLRRYDKEKKR